MALAIVRFIHYDSFADEWVCHWRSAEAWRAEQIF